MKPDPTASRVGPTQNWGIQEPSGKAWLTQVTLETTWETSSHLYSLSAGRMPEGRVQLTLRTLALPVFEIQGDSASPCLWQQPQLLRGRPAHRLLSLKLFWKGQAGYFQRETFHTSSLLTFLKMLAISQRPQGVEVGFEA